ncbi:MAG: phosphatase PAP2 family protein [Betaproteobacteria bacterium]|nr:phosphatase PAP2 family protein [Betaproteobacteria bacterium]
MALNTSATTHDATLFMHIPRWVLSLALMFILTGAGMHLSPSNVDAMLGLHQMDTGPQALWSFATQFGDAGAALLLLLVASRFAPSGASLIFKCLILGSVVSRLCKTLIASPRPLGVLDPALLQIIGNPPSGPNSMPSGHAMTVAAMLCLLFLMFPKQTAKPWLGLPMVVVAGVVALSRVIVGAHWPADVLVGLGLGLLTAWFAWLWDLRSDWSPRLNKPTGQYLLILIELGLVISLFVSQADTPAARLAFDVIATVGMAGTLARYASLRRRQAAQP